MQETLQLLDLSQGVQLSNLGINPRWDLGMMSFVRSESSLNSETCQKLYLKIVFTSETVLLSKTSQFHEATHMLRINC